MGVVTERLLLLFRMSALLLLLLVNLRVYASPDLPQRTVDPTAPLPTISLRDDHTIDIYGMEGQRHAYSLRVTNPYIAWQRSQLMSLSVPYNTGDSLTSGVAQLFHLTIFNRDWGRFGVGVNAALDPSVLGSRAIQYGPALGIVRVVERCNFGALNLNFFAENVSVSALQLIAGCSIGDGWTISSGGFTPRYNWETEKFIDVPISLQIAKVVHIAGQPLQLFVNPHYNVQDTPGTSRWAVAFGATLVANPFEWRNE